MSRERERERGSRGSRGSRDQDNADEDRPSGRSGRGGGRGSREGRGGKHEYQSRSPDQWKKREERGGDWDKMFKEDIKALKIKDGANCIRIVEPTWDNPEHFGLDIWVHYSVGPDKQTYLCPDKMNGDPCPVCEERARAVRDGDEEYAKQLEARKRVLVYLVDRDNEKEGVLVWAMPKSFDTDLIAISQDKRTGEILQIDDPVNGFDINFDKTGTKDRTKYVGISVARRSSELGDDSWRDFAWDNPLPSILNFYSYDHMSKAFSGGSAPSKPADREERTSSRGSREPEYTWESIHEMTFDEMSDLVDNLKLDIDPEDSNDDVDLADWICDELELKKQAKSGGRKALDKEEESPREKLAKMREARNRD